jgi:hypothetical protein
MFSHSRSIVSESGVLDRLQQRPSGPALARWPQLAGVEVKFRGGYAYVAGRLPND